VNFARWLQRGDEWTFDVQADAFLYRMVRRLVYVQVAVGQGRLKADDLVRALEDREKLPAGLAPSCGLTLVSVEYERPE
jgi:tRNA pseudouridine38-40 synthase